MYFLTSYAYNLKKEGYMQELKADNQPLVINKDSALYNHFYKSTSDYSDMKLDIYTSTLVKNLLRREPRTEYEFRQIPPNKEIKCDCLCSGDEDCFCKRLFIIRNIINTIPDYNNGLK